MKIKKDQFISHTISLISSDVKPFLDMEVVNILLGKEFDFIEKKVLNVDFAWEYKRIIDIPNTVGEDYLSHEIEIDGIIVLISLRFFGMDKSKPFIGLDFFDCSYDVLFSKWHKIEQMVYEKYKVFVPFAINVFLPSDIDLHLYGIKFNTDVDLYVMPISNTTTMLGNDVSIVQVNTFSIQEYDRYLEAYRLFNEQQNIKEFLKPEIFEDIIQWCKTDKVFKVFFDSKWAGLLILEKGNNSFFYGYCVVEKLIFEEFRGLNLSSKAHHIILNTFLDRSEKGFLFGTIYADHLASITSAVKAGRACTYRYIMISIN